jgi:hypothetical protein
MAKTSPFRQNSFGQLMKKPVGITNEEHWRTSCQVIVNLAHSILDQKIGIIEGARKLASYRHDVKAESDKDFLFFVGLDSETDHLPVGDVEKNWNPEVLEDKKKEIAGYEAGKREAAFQACRNLVSKYGPESG